MQERNKCRACRGRQGGQTLATIVKQDHRAALDILDDLLESVPGTVRIGQQPTKMIIVPDGISAANLRTYVTKTNRAAALQDLFITTFEDLSACVTGRNEILDKELLRLVVTAAILRMNHLIAERIQRGLRGTGPLQDNTIIDHVVSELEEYAAYVAPFSNEPPDSLSFPDTRLLDETYRQRATYSIEFYGLLLESCEQVLSELDLDGAYLTRAHLVSHAASILSTRTLQGIRETSSIEEIYVLGVPILDNTVLRLLLQLIRSVDLLVLGLTPEIAKRTGDRINAMMGDQDVVIQTVERPHRYQVTDAFEIPDRRREVEFAAVRCLELLSNAERREHISPEDILIVARLAADYKSYFEPVFSEFGLPSFMKIREKLILSPVYRLVESLIDLIVKCQSGNVVSASEIAQPLRLGFPIPKQGKSGLRWASVDDRRYLAIETELERMERYERKATVEEWIERIQDPASAVSDRQRYFLFDPPRRLLEWVKEMAGKDPSVRPLIEKVRQFSEVYGIERSYPMLNLVWRTRLEICSEHISSQAMRVEMGLRRIAGRQKQVAAARVLIGEKRHSEDWSDLLRAYRGVVGGITYGRVQRDADAITFLDAGISHFVDAKCRIIVGLTNDQFPRKYPDPFLLFDELRDLMNRPQEGLYIQNRTTHREIERYLFDAALGRAEKLILTMNYLDDRGHHQGWSVFFQGTDSRKIPAHVLRTELSVEARPFVPETTPNISTALFDLIRASRSGTIDTCITEIRDLASSELCPERWRAEIESTESCLRALKERVVEGRFEFDIGLGPDSFLYRAFSFSRAPSLWEIDLLTYCPAMYYFYVFYHLLPHSQWIERREKVDDPIFYVPAYKKGFMGHLPLPVWRTQFSTRATRWILENIGTGQIGDLNARRDELTKKLDGLRVSPGEIHALRNFLARLAECKAGVKIKAPGEASAFDYKVVRPILFSPAGSRSHRVAFKLGPIEPFACSHIQGIKGYIFVEHFGSSGSKYRRFSDDYMDWETATIALSSTEQFEEILCAMDLRRATVNGNVCQQCHYRTLCGDWGF
ncbi:MAG: hypothetical protein ACTSYX_12635 [Candidatus Thorarchaeota archaeon]